MCVMSRSCKEDVNYLLKLFDGEVSVIMSRVVSDEDGWEVVGR